MLRPLYKFIIAVGVASVLGLTNGVSAKGDGRSLRLGAEVEQREPRHSSRKADSERAEATALFWGGAYHYIYKYTCVWTVWPHDRSYVGNNYFRKTYHRGFTFKMPILLFLLDTSASMNQRTYLGTTYLDVAKGAVEVFMKVKNDFTPIFIQ